MNKKASRILSTILVLCLTFAIAIPAFADGNSVMAELWRNITVFVDGKEVSSDSFIVNDTTYIPARSVGETMGAQVGWNEETRRVYVDTVKVDDKAAEYLTEYFKVDPMTGTVSAEIYTAALTAVFGKDAVAMTGTTLADAVAATVANCGLKELPATYSAEKAAARTAGIVGVTEENAATVATALDASLASGTWEFNAELKGDTATQLLMNAVNIAGKGRNYLGNVSDPDITQKLMSAWATFGNFDDPILSQLGAELVIAEASTGYNLKHAGYNANFLPAYTLQYGHSDIIHAVQLMVLLNSEGIDAKVALEPKTSIYEYLVEWGDPTQVPSTPTYELRPIEGTDRWLCYATEYDMKLEFDTIDEKNAFDTLIQKYAKKWLDKVDENGEPTENLLAGAWFQPLYTSTVPMADTDNFTTIQDNVITNGVYSIHPFSQKDANSAIVSVVKEKAPDLTVDPVILYVNNAFYRYLSGTGGD